MPEKGFGVERIGGLLFASQDEGGDEDSPEITVGVSDLVKSLRELEYLIPNLMASTAPHHESPPAGKRLRCRSRAGKGSSQFRDGRLSVRR